jgi:hypothetical protein
MALSVFTQYPVVTSHTFKALSLLAPTSKFPDDNAPAAPEGMKRMALTL